MRKIVDAGNRLLDRLRLVEAAKSMRGLLICLKVGTMVLFALQSTHSPLQGFSEPLFIMLALLDKRLKVPNCMHIVIIKPWLMFAGAHVSRHEEGFN